MYKKKYLCPSIVVRSSIMMPFLGISATGDNGTKGGDLSKQRNIFEVETLEDFESKGLWDDFQ